MAPKKAKAKARSSGSASPPPRGKAKAKAKANKEAEATPPTPEEMAAARLRAFAHSFLARRLLGNLLEEHQQKEAELAEAVRAAEMVALKLERRRDEQARVKEAEKKAKARKIKEDTKKMLAAAFDGDVALIGRLLDGGLHVDAKDANGITSLSEAAAGGQGDAVRLLIERRSDPNSRGEFDRTPLWRACYAGHADLIPVLLEAGCDPRLYDDQGQAPVDISSKDCIIETLRSWDVAKTDDLVEEYESWAEDIRLAEDFKQKEAMRSVTAHYEQARQQHEAAQAALARAKVAMRKREHDHGLGLAAGSEEARMACSSAAAEVERAEEAARAARKRFDETNLERLTAAEECGATTDLPGKDINVTDLNNVLLRDLGDRLAKAPKWPLVIDASDCARKLLVYAGCAVLNFWRPDEMDPRRLRIALLSMIRAGGVLAIDLACVGAGVDRQLLAQPFDEVRPWLFGELLERDDGLAKLLAPPPKQRWPHFHDLVEKDEKKSYGVEHFDDQRLSKFKFVVLTSTEHPHKDLLGMFDVLRAVAAS